MKKSKFTESQIVGALKMADSGAAVADICREMGISTNTFYQWKRTYSGFTVTESRRLKDLERENARMRKLIADLTLDRHMLQEVIAKKL